MQELAEEKSELKAGQRQLWHEHVQTLKDTVAPPMTQSADRSTSSSTGHDCISCVMQELAEERSELKAGQRQLRHEHVQLLKDKAASQAKLAELQQKAKDVQMLKFGQVPQTHYLTFFNYQVTDAYSAPVC